MDELLLKVAGGGAFILATFGLSYLRSLSEGLSTLNANMAGLLARLEAHDKRIERLESDR